MSDLSGFRLPQGLAVKAKKMRSSRGIPDLLILEPRGNYCGLLIELKREGMNPFKKDGTIKSDIHLEEQHLMLKNLEAKGYKATFASGYDIAKEIIDNYLKVKP